MMVPLLRISLCVGITLYFILIMYFLKKKSLNLKYTILWIVSGITMLTVVIFPQLIHEVSIMLGIMNPVNAVFALELFFLLVILMSITSIVSKQSEKIKQLIQRLALLEKRVRELEDDLTKK
jgi:hypothetical protein